jgi:hypothetical protein
MKYLVSILLLFFFFKIFPQATYTSDAIAGNWGTTTTWTLTSGSDTESPGIPDGNDNVIILNGHTVTISADASAKTLTINNGGTLNGGNKYLTAYGDINNSGSIVNSSLQLWLNGNSTVTSSSNIILIGLTVYSKILTVSSGTSISVPNSNISIRAGGTLNNSGTISCKGFNTINSTGNSLNNLNSGSITVISDFPSSGLTVSNSTGSTVNYNNGTTTILNTTYHHINLSGTSKTVSANLTVNGNLTITTSTLSLSTRNLSVSGNLTNSGSITQTSGTVSIAGTTTCSGTSVITVGTLNQTGNFTVSSGTLNLGSTTANLSGSLSNSGTISSTGTINVAGSLTFTGSGNLASNNTSTVVMNGSSAQIITIPVATTVPFNNLTCSNSGGLSFSGGNLNINNNLNLTSGNLALGNRSVSIKGNISSSGTGNIASGAGETNEITLNGTSVQTITNTSGSSLNIYNLTCNNSSASINLSSGNLSVNNNLTVTTGTLALGSNNLSVSGNLTNSGTITQTSGTVSVSGTTSCSGTSVITVGTLNQTGNFTISSGNLNFGSTTANLSGSLSNSGTISSSGTINIAGNLSFSATGNLAGDNTSHIVINGSTSQSISSSNSSNIPFSRLTFANSSGNPVTLTCSNTGRFTISDSIVVQTGSLNAGTELLTLLSNSTKTAVIGRSVGSISGRVILQRFISTGGYRKYDLGSTVSSTTIDDWDDELYMSIGASNNTPGYPGGDGSSGGAYSCFKYDNQLNASKKYVAVLTGSALEVGRGYQTLIADDLTSFTGRAIDSRGTPNMGTISLPVFRTGTDGFNLVANPFQAHIDWSQVSKSNVSSTVYFLENNGTKFTYFNPRIDPNIPPGLGFMCVATGANPSVSITQSAKVASNSSNIGFRLNPISEEISDLKLRISSLQNAEYNEADLFFDKKAISGFDFEKDFLFGESLIEDAPIITFTDAGKQFIRNYFNDEIETVYFPLSITTPIAGNYSIDLEGLYESNAYQDAYLMNNLTKEKYKLTNNQTASIYFDKNTHEQFQLVLSKKSTDEINSAASSNLINVFATATDIVIKNGTINQQELSIKVYSALGQLVLNQTSELSEKSELRIPTETFKSDVYFVQLRTASGNEFTKKIVITK